MTDWAGIADNIIFTLGIGLIIGSMVLPVVYKNIISMLVNGLMSPLTSHMPFYLVILVIAIALSTFTTLVRKYKIDGDLVRRFNQKNLALQKELREAQLAGNKNKLKKLGEEQLILMEDQKKITMQNLKSTGYTMIISILLLMWISWYLGSQPAPLTMTLPLIGTYTYSDLFLMIPYWSLWLAICSIAAGYVIRKVVNSTV
jgi:uncharacterized membrane protein (DUF106 family)